jgi:hypothetical protein
LDLAFHDTELNTQSRDQMNAAARSDFARLAACLARDPNRLGQILESDL